MRNSLLRRKRANRLIFRAASFGIELRLLDFFEKFGIEDRRAHTIVTRCPRSQIEDTATIRTERHVRRVERDFFLADRALQSFCHSFQMLESGAKVLRTFRGYSHAAHRAQEIDSRRQMVRHGKFF